MSDDIRKGQDSSDVHENRADFHSETNGANLSRRKFAKAGLIATPIIMTLSGRSAMGAYQCTVSGMLSGNLSNQVDGVVCGSKSEGVWKGAKALGMNGMGQLRNYSGDYPNHWWPVPYTPLTPFHSVFSTALYDYGDATMLQVMNASSDLGISDDQNVGFAAMGSLLNAKYYGKESFGYSDLEIIALWDSGSMGTQELHDYYSALNHRWDAQSIPPWG